MSPLIAVVVSALERAAVLVDRGAKPGAALRQVATELAEYEENHYGHQMPTRPFEIGGPAPMERRPL